MPAPFCVEADCALWGGRLRRGVVLTVGEDGTWCEPDSLPASVERVRLPGRVILPGLVNAHSHAFQRLIRGRTEYVAAGRSSDDFWSWREAMYRVAGTLEPEGLYAASKQAFLEMALSGMTAVGEFHYLQHAPDGTPYADRNALAKAVIRAARDVGLRIVLLRVGYARAGFRTEAHPWQRRFVDRDAEAWLAAAETLRAEVRGDWGVSVGLAPHSVRAVPVSWLEALARAPAPTRGVVHMHVAEQPAEVEACLAEHGARPVELLEGLGLLDSGFTAVHGIHLSPDEISRMGRAGSTVCACPSTERNLGDGVVSADLLRAAGVGLALGSDSQARVDLLDEARQLDGHLRLVRLRRAPLDPGGGQVNGLAAELLGCATLGGARSLGLPSGELRTGAPADFFTVDLNHPSLVGARHESLLAEVVFGAGADAVKDVAVAGRWIVRDGRHPDQERIGREYAALNHTLRLA